MKGIKRILRFAGVSNSFLFSNSAQAIQPIRAGKRKHDGRKKRKQACDSNTSQAHNGKLCRPPSGQFIASRHRALSETFLFPFIRLAAVGLNLFFSYLCHVLYSVLELKRRTFALWSAQRMRITLKATANQCKLPPLSSNPFIAFIDLSAV